MSVELREHGMLNEAIKDAYTDKNAEKSRKLHEAKMKHKKVSDDSDNEEEDGIIFEVPTEENHKALGEYVKSIIYGGLDGIITTFAIVAGISGATLSTEVILVLGFANLIADGLSMGIGDYLSEVSELEYIQSEKKREEWEFDNYKEGEIQEMIEIYKKKGISLNDAELILRTMSKYREFFVSHMLVQELELQPPSGDEQPMKGGIVTLLSFLCFGCVPLLSYIILAQIDFNDNFDPRFLISCILTILCLFGLGVFKGKITESSMIKSGFFICSNGIFAAGMAYLIAYGLSQLVGISDI